MIPLMAKAAMISSDGAAMRSLDRGDGNELSCWRIGNDVLFGNKFGRDPACLDAGYSLLVGHTHLIRNGHQR